MPPFDGKFSLHPWPVKPGDVAALLRGEDSPVHASPLAAAMAALTSFHTLGST